MKKRKSEIKRSTKRLKKKGTNRKKRESIKRRERSRNDFLDDKTNEAYQGFSGGKRTLAGKRYRITQEPTKTFTRKLQSSPPPSLCVFLYLIMSPLH